MKRLRCPKCDASILFDETRYAAGRVLVFECPDCHKQFKIRMPASVAPAQTQKAEQGIYGELVVIENAFHFKQIIPLREGENVIGRLVKGGSANAAFKTVDPSVDTTHCIVSVTLSSAGTPKFALRDAPSNTGTFLQTRLLAPRERTLLTDGDIINIGATTLIFHTATQQEK